MSNQITKPLTARQLADRYLVLLNENDTRDAVREALTAYDDKPDDRYEIVGELMDTACEMGYDNDGRPESDDVLYDLAEDACDLVAEDLARA